MKAALPLRGAITMPGDKSISHRALILATLARGPARITGINPGADVRATARCLGALGVACSFDEDNRKVELEGRGWDGLGEPTEILDAGNSGTTLRCLLGVCAGVEGLSVLTGDGSLRNRPMLRVVSPLRQMGATIDGRAHGDRAPLVVRGGPLTGIDIELPVASAQVKTALLLAGLRAGGVTRVIEPTQTRDHTERMLAAAGVAVETGDRGMQIRGGSEPAAADRWVPGDVSAAMFFVTAACLVPDSDLKVEMVGLNPTRTAALEVLREMGADVTWEVAGASGGEPYGTITARASELAGIVIEGPRVATVIDELPILMIAASRARGATELRDAGELRVKESDRIATIAAGLAALGGGVAERPDGLTVHGGATLTGGSVDARGDHRIAMAFAIAGLVAPERVRVQGWSSVETSFPDFLEVLGEARSRR